MSTKSQIKEIMMNTTNNYEKEILTTYMAYGKKILMQGLTKGKGQGTE